MMRIINSRLYQGLIPVTNYLILGVIATAGVATVFFAYPVIAACIGVAIQIYGKGNETLTKKLWLELKRHFWTKLFIGLIVSTFALLFYFVFTDLFVHLVLPLRVSLLVSLVLFLALVFYLILEEVALGSHYHFSRFFRNAVLDLVLDFPFTLFFAAMMLVVLVAASLFPLTVFFSLTFMNLIMAAVYHKRLKSKLSRF
ncbi:hypothetical protein ACFQ5J_12700 [Lacticaseibacillus baoqingensis]|uniref:DUF624 domain-containing protein n=1 Tax=Lacticaseibacillus baoqingensis TaxID=2486013 RepID=A0ABW4E850_9LACO|nr:hypothetical protein [Lacticaseibacillus baoqingensis]